MTSLIGRPKGDTDAESQASSTYDSDDEDIDEVSKKCCFYPASVLIIKLPLLCNLQHTLL